MLVAGFKRLACNVSMKTVGQIRRENLERLVLELGTLEKVAEAGGSSSVYMSQIRKQTLDKSTQRPREMGSAMARRLEAGCGKPAGWMDLDQSQEPLPLDLTTARSKRMPLPGIDFAKVSALSPEDQLRLEGAWIDTAQRLSFDVAATRRVNRKVA